MSCSMNCLTAGTVVLILTFPSPAQPPRELGDPACPGSGSCCVGHGGPGCDNLTCCNNVCAADFLCCFVWDSDCAALADQICGSVCAGSCPSTGDCCTTHAGGGCGDEVCCDLVCLEMPECCETGWSSDCASLADIVCDVCEDEPTFLCPQPGDCCTDHFLTGGCDREGCCVTVCRIDDYCCNTGWDSVCVNLAEDHCLNVCSCPQFGNFDDHAAIDLQDAAIFQNCYSGDASPPVPAECSCGDYDGDGDVDLPDFAIFADLLNSKP